MIAALFVQADGVYADLPNVDLWPESRDARKYAGPYPDQRGKAANKPTLSKKEANATPIAFRDDLIALANRSMYSQRIQKCWGD